MRPNKLADVIVQGTPLISCFVVCLCVAGVISSAAASEFWPMYQGNASHSGYVPVLLNLDGSSLRWEKTVASSRVLNPITTAEGKIFVSVHLNFKDEIGLYVLDAATGNTLWTKDFGPVRSVNPPSYAYGNVYIQTGNHRSDTYLHAYNAETSALVFLSPHSAQWEEYYAPTIYDGSVYINGGYTGGMYSFDAFTGTQNWFKNLPQHDQWTPAVDDMFAYAYFGAGLYVVNRHTGIQAFYIQDPNFDWHGSGMNLAPVLGSSNNVLVIQRGRLISFDLDNHTVGWELPRNFVGQPSVAKRVIYAIDGGNLTAWDEATGDPLWTWETPGDYLTGTLIVTETHVLARTAGEVFAIDLTTHSDVWSYPASGHLALGQDVLYLAGDDGNVTAINLVTEVPLPGEIRGMKFNDLDGDGLFEPGDGEAGLEGWTIYLDLNANGQLDQGEPSDVTDSDGNYTITTVVPDTYIVTEVPQDDWQQRFPTDNGTHVTTVLAGQIVEGIDFGNRFVREFDSIDPTLDALASSTDGVNFVIIDGQLSINVQYLPSANINRRGILEFDLSQLPPGVPIASASLELQVMTITYDSDGTTTTYPVLELHGYRGNGVAEVADATVPFNLIGSSDPIEELGLIAINLDTNYIESLLGTATHLGLLAYPGIEGLQTGFWTSEAASFANPPKLTIQYIAEPVCGDANHLYPIGDLDYNCHVNWGDFSIFVSHWLDSGCIAPTWCGGADLNQGGEVAWSDFALFAAHWLECTAPECD